MRIALFALTGVGNPVIEALCQAGLAPELVVTREEAGPYPHYPCENIGETARRYSIPLHIGLEGENMVSVGSWDLILAATYHRVLSQTLLDRAGNAINFHPSLLPKYRGPNPFYWVIANGERETGVTAHKLVSELDRGDIYAQRSYTLAPDETEASLRRRLADLTAPLAVEMAMRAQQGSLIGVAQDERQASYYPRPKQVS